MSAYNVDPYTPILIAQAGEQPTTTHAVTGAPAPAESSSEHETSPWWFFTFAMIALVTLVVLSALATRRIRRQPQDAIRPRGLQNLFEILVEAIYSIPEQVMGARGRQYAPFLGTFFLYILVMNLSGLIPGFKSGTANLSITLALALVAFISAQYFGFRTHGIGYLKHFAGPVIWLAPLILPLELVSEFIRPVSLSIRLYGNIYGEEQVVGALAQQISPFAAVLMLPLQLLTSVLQALVFTLLLTVYIALATENHADHAETSDAH